MTYPAAYPKETTPQSYQETPMEKFTRKTLFVFSRLLFILLVNASAITNGQINETGSDHDRTLSPYFFVQSDDPSLDQLPLKSTSADVDIAGVIADVKVTQVYKNTGKRKLEAIYVFPGSTRAAVYGMKMTIGERVVEAKIEEKGKARADYEAAKSQGKSASLLEQQRPNVFQMNVANIMPGDEIKVELFYTELLIPDEGTYTFAYPTVVGPRYSTQPAALASADEKWVANPYTSEGKKPLYAFDIETKIQAGLPIHGIKSTSHEVNVSFTGPDKASVKLLDTEKFGGNRDYILKYQLTGKKVETGLLLYEGEKENFFLLLMQPPKRIVPENIPPREYIFIVDVSGSMSGFPLNTSKELLRNLIGKLRPIDKFNVMLFASSNRVLNERSLPATEANINQAIATINQRGGGGGTNLLPALKRALALPGIEDVSRTVVIATDGYVTVEKEAFDLIRDNLGQANFFSFGIGSSVNRYIIEGMAHVGMGSPFVVTKPAEARSIANKFREYIQSPVLTDIELDFNGFEVYDAEPLQVPDVFAERPVIVFGKYKGSAKGTITLKGKTGSGLYMESIDVGTVRPQAENTALMSLWARHRIQMLSDYARLRNAPAVKDEVTRLGLDYNLLTAYTSFVAIDSEVRGDGTPGHTVKQPLPLPKGVSNNAVGGTGAYGLSMNGARSSGSTHQVLPSSSVQTIKSVEMVAVKSSRRGKVRKYKSPAIAADVVEVEEELSDADNGTSGGGMDPIDLSKKEDDKSKDEVFAIAEVMPMFPGGEKKLQEYLKKKTSYPSAAKDAGIQGKVYVSFIVGKDGKIRDVKIIRGVHKLLDMEALRVVGNMPHWKPGMQRGKPVAVRYTVPINFQL